ncbi:MAG: hypothetical protein ACXITV_03010 [Luteibaculaceae bacterium]
MNKLTIFLLTVCLMHLHCAAQPVILDSLNVSFFPEQRCKQVSLTAYELLVANVCKKQIYKLYIQDQKITVDSIPYKREFYKLSSSGNNVYALQANKFSNLTSAKTVFKLRGKNKTGKVNAINDFVVLDSLGVLVYANHTLEESYLVVNNLKTKESKTIKPHRQNNPIFQSLIRNSSIFHNRENGLLYYSDAYHHDILQYNPITNQEVVFGEKGKYVIETDSSELDYTNTSVSEVYLSAKMHFYYINLDVKNSKLYRFYRIPLTEDLSEYKYLSSQNVKNACGIDSFKKSELMGKVNDSEWFLQVYSLDNLELLYDGPEKAYVDNAYIFLPYGKLQFSKENKTYYLLE